MMKMTIICDQCGTFLQDSVFADILGKDFCCKFCLCDYARTKNLFTIELPTKVIEDLRIPLSNQQESCLNDIKCIKCGGKGKINNGKYLSNYGITTYECPDCQGTGRNFPDKDHLMHSITTCGRCNGRGKVDDCGGAGTFICPGCEGTGKID